MGICYGLDAKERDDIRIISLTALRNSFSFIREQMEKQVWWDVYIKKKVFYLDRKKETQSLWLTQFFKN